MTSIPRNESPVKLTPAQQKALKRLAEVEANPKHLSHRSGWVNPDGISGSTRKSLKERGLIEEKYPYYRLTSAGRAALGVEPPAPEPRYVLVPADLLMPGNRIGKYVAGKFNDWGVVTKVEPQGENLVMVWFKASEDDELGFTCPANEAITVAPDTWHPNGSEPEPRADALSVTFVCMTGLLFNRTNDVTIRDVEESILQALIDMRSAPYRITIEKLDGAL